MTAEVDTAHTNTKTKPGEKGADQPASADAAHVSPFHKELHDTQRSPQQVAAESKVSAPALKAVKPEVAPVRPGSAPEAHAPVDASHAKIDAPVPPKPGSDSQTSAAVPAAGAKTDAPHLAQAIIDKKAEELHAAVLKTGWFGRSKPDTKAVTEAMSGTTEADRKAIEAAYQTKWGTAGSPDKLRNDMRQHLGEEDFRRAESTLNSHDGHTNDAGALMTAMATAKNDKERGSNDVRSILQSLDSKTMAQVGIDFENTYHEKLTEALSKADLNQTAKDSIPTLLQGVDKMTPDNLVKLAHVALANNDQRAFCEAIRGDSAEAKDARTKLLQEPGIHEQIQNAFAIPPAMGDEGYPLPAPNDKNWKQNIDPVVADYLDDGKVSLKTVIESNRPGWPFNNPENTSLAVQHATDSERARFTQGRDLESSKATNLTPEQKSAVDYYHQVHDALENTGTARAASTLEDQLVHGRETIVSQMAQTHSDGYTGLHLFASGDKQDLLSRAEHLSKEDWALLSTHPQGTESAADAAKRSADFRKEIDQSLSTYADPGEKTQIMAMLDQKAGATSYEASQQIKRSLTEVIDENTSHGLLGGTNYDTKNIVAKLGDMSQQDVDKYTNPKPPAPNEYRTGLDGFVSTKLQGAEQLEAQRLLAKTDASNKPPVADAIDHLLMAKINGAEPLELVGLSEKALADPALRQRLNQSDDKLTPEDKELKAQIQDASARLEMKNTPVFASEGAVASIGPTADDVNKELFQNGHIPAAMKFDLGFDRKDIIADLPSASQAERDAAGTYLSTDEKQVVDQASKNADHQFSLADRMRLAAVDSKGVPSTNGDFEQELGKLSNDQKIALKNEYAAKYGHGDLDSDFAKSLDNDPDRLKFKQLLAITDTDGRQKYYDNYDAMLKSESGLSPDGSKLTLERANDLYATSMQEYQRIYKTLPPEKQEALDKYFGSSMEQYKQSKEKLAEIAVDATITAAALAAAPFTGGASTLVLMSSAAAFGATFRVGAMAAIEGNDFDASGKNIAKQLVIGGTSAAMNFFGGAGLAGAAEQGGRVITEEGAVAAAKLLAKEAAQSGFVGASANVISDLVVAPFNKDGVDMGQLEQSALSGLIMGAVVPIAFKGVSQIAGSGLELVVNVTKDAHGFNIDPRNLTSPVSFRNAHTGEVRNFKPNEGEPMKLTKEWLPAEVAVAATAAAAPPVAEAAIHKALKPPTEVTQVVPPPPSPPVVPASGATHTPPVKAPEVSSIPATVPQTHEPLRLASATRTTPPEGVEVPGAQVLERTKSEGEQPRTESGAQDQSTEGGTDSSTKPALEKGDKHPWERRAEPGADQAIARPPEVTLQQRLDAMAQKISDRTVDRPITKEQFKSIFDGMSDSDRKIALQVMEQSAPNMTSRELDNQMRGLWDKLRNTGTPTIQSEGVTVYTLNATDNGNMLAQLLRVKGAQQIKLNVVELDAPALARMKVDGVPHNGLFFDDISHATAEQKALLREVPNLQVTDLNGFDQGLNMIDFGAAKFQGTQGIRDRVDSMIEAAHKLQADHPGLSDADAVSQLMKGNTREQVTELGPNAHYVRPKRELKGQQLREATAPGDENYQINSLYNQFTQPYISTDQVQQFIANLPKGNREAGAAVLQDGVQMFGYPTMMDELRNLKENVFAKMPPGTKPEDAIYITNLEKPNAGSHLIINTLYAKVNGVNPEQFMSIEQLKALGPNGAAGRPVVFLDDFSISGRQVAGLVRDNAETLSESGGRVVVGTIGDHAVDTDPWRLHETDSRYQALKNVDVTPVANHTYPNLFDANFLRQTGLDRFTEQLMGGWVNPGHDSQITSYIITPYGGPNNNARFLGNFAKETGLRNGRQQKFVYDFTPTGN